MKIYANNKPWLTKKYQHILNMKKKAVLQQDKDEMKREKEEYKRTTEDNFKCNISNNMKKVCGGMLAR